MHIGIFNISGNSLSVSSFLHRGINLYLLDNLCCCCCLPVWDSIVPCSSGLELTMWSSMFSWEHFKDQMQCLLQGSGLGRVGGTGSSISIDQGGCGRGPVRGSLWDSGMGLISAKFPSCGWENSGLQWAVWFQALGMGVILASLLQSVPSGQGWPNNLVFCCRAATMLCAACIAECCESCIPPPGIRKV